MHRSSLVKDRGLEYSIDWRVAPVGLGLERERMNKCFCYCAAALTGWVRLYIYNKGMRYSPSRAVVAQSSLNSLLFSNCPCSFFCLFSMNIGRRKLM